MCRVLADTTMNSFLTSCSLITEIGQCLNLLRYCFSQLFSSSPLRFPHLFVSRLTPIRLHVQVRMHWTAIYQVCASVTKPTHAYATRGTNCCHMTDSTSVQPNLLTVFVSSASPKVAVVAAGLQGQAATVVVFASRVRLSPSSSATGLHLSPGPSTLSLRRPLTAPDFSQVSIT